MRKFWRIMKLTTLGLLGTVGVALIWLAVANAAADSKVEKKLAELREAGQPISLAALARKPIPPESNAATYLRRAAEELAAIEKAIESALDGTSQQEQAEFYRFRATAAVQKTLQSAFASFPNAVPLLEKAAERPDYDPQLDYSKGPGEFLDHFCELSQDVRQPIRVLNYRVVMLQMEGKRDEAFQTCMTMFRLIRHLEHRPMLISLLVSLAVRGVAISAADNVLRSGPLPPSAYDALEAELARHDLAAAWQEALRTERAFGIDQFGEYRTTNGYGKLPIGKKDLASYLELLEAAIQNAPLPYSDEQAQARIRAILDRSGALTKLFSPALQATSQAAARTAAKLRSLRVLNAILRRQQAGRMDEPKLADLGLPAEATTDPFSGDPLVLKKTADGWLIYSVGTDLKDDGGQIDDGVTDVGLAPVPPVQTESHQP
ncbi:MAG: hypothetical protein WD468_03035 [Pirellulales bacterium]